MPLNVFDAISPTVSTLLGGASVDLRSGAEEGKTGDGVLLQGVTIEGKQYSFAAQRPGLPFTKTEQQFCTELLTAFSGLYSGFKLEGYAAHFRTALLASIMDITVARFLRGDRSKGFWPISS